MKILTFENCYKIAIIFSAIVISSSIFYKLVYLEMNKKSIDNIDLIVATSTESGSKDEVYNPIITTTNSVKDAISQSQVNFDNKQRISDQLKMFEDFLEYSLVPAEVNCIVFSTYNNVNSNQSMDPQSFKSAFPDTREHYKEECESSYFKVANNRKKLLAQPELQNLRILLSSYSEEVVSFALYALKNGYSSSVIDSSDKKMESFRTLSREELIKLKIKYNL